MQNGEIRLVHGACPHDCPDTCAMITDVRDGRAVAISGDPNHPITQGWLCAKVRPYLDRVYHPDRLLHPLRRVGVKGSGEWERISWEEAIDEITSRWAELINDYGAASILPYSFSGTLGIVQNAIISTRLWNRMGASGLERSICGAAAETAVSMTYGSRWAPDTRDVAHSKLVIIWGHNPASTAPHFMPFVRQAQKNGTYVIVIDPRRTITARSADEHIRPRPATDGALALGMINVIFSEQLHDEPWLERNTIGWRELRVRAADYPVEQVAAITGLDAETIVSLARRFASSKPAILKFSDGIQRHGNGGQTVRALAALPAVAGHVGKLGGGLMYSTSGYSAWDDEAFGHAAECPPVPRVINMNRIGAALTGEADDPPVMSLYVFNANPVASSPNAPLTIQGLLREDLFTVVHDLFMTDTARYADIVLPATSQLEQTDFHRAYGHRFLQFNEQAIAPLGEAKSNWDVMRLLAAGMGYHEPWLQQTSEEVIAEILGSSAKTNSHLKGITLERLQAEGTVPLNFDEHGDVPFADGYFPTESGKLELKCDAMAAVGLDTLPHYEPPTEFRDYHPGEDGRLILISGAAHHFVSSSLANVPKLQAKEGYPSVEINPLDAEQRGIVDGEDVILSNARGWCRLRAIVTEDTPSGVAIAPKGQWVQNSPDNRNVNWTTSDAIADLAGQSTFHSNLVIIRPARLVITSEHDVRDAVPADD
ncbi:MAG TPA: molybdopterin oxidoreductase family protein [Nitrolancea sp.]|nr:molybdopterin oxidoreductase family protein [Nitrolancea sp.]